MLNQNKFNQGVQILSTDKDFSEGLSAAVDYRGDVTLELKDGTKVDGFLFSAFQGNLDLFPKNSPQKQRIKVEDLKSIHFSGKDEAAGKAWEDWVKSRDQKPSSSSPDNQPA